MDALCGQRSGRRGRRLWPLLAALITAAVLLITACSSPEPPTPAGPATARASTGPGKAVTPPDTPAGAQLGWLIAAMAHLPISDADVRAHFDAGYLVNPAVLNQWLQAVNEWLQAEAGAKLVSIKVDQPSMVAAGVSGGAGPRARVGLTVGSRGLIGDLDISPAIAGPVPATLGRCRCRPPFGCTRGPPARRQRRQRLVPACAQHRPRQRGAVRLGLEALCASRTGECRGLGQGQLGPANDRHRAAQEPSLRCAPV
jgi:hypothetical protein